MNKRKPNYPQPIYEIPSIDRKLDQKDLPFFIDEEHLPEHNNRTFLICVIDCHPSFKAGQEKVNKEIKIFLQDYINQAQIFKSRRSISKLNRGTSNLAEIKSHPLLHLGINLIFSITPPPTYKGQIFLFKLQTIINESRILITNNLQTIWLRAEIAKETEQCRQLIQYTFHNLAQLEQKLKFQEEGLIGLGIEIIKIVRKFRNKLRVL